MSLSQERGCRFRHRSRTRTFLDGQDFLFLLFGDVFEFVDVVVGEFLDFRQAVLFVVLGNAFVLEHLLEVIVTVAADVTYSGAVIPKNLVNMFSELLPPIFGERWNRN